MTKIKHTLSSIKIGKIILYVVMIGIAFVFLYPFIYMIVNSLMTNEDLNNFSVTWIPRKINFANYSMAANIIKYFSNFKNSLIITILATLGQLISCSMAGYAMARFKNKANNVLFIVMILAILVPVQTIIVPEYLFYSNIGWLNTYAPMVIPSWFGYGLNGALYIFIFRQFYLGFPKSVEEAAKVDGCGFLRVFFNIVFPVSKSSYVVVLVLALVFHWNNSYEPAMFLSEKSMHTVPMGLENIIYTLSLPPEIMSSSYGINADNSLNNAVLMAGVFMVVLPILIAFCFLQKMFIQGIEHTGLTGE